MPRYYSLTWYMSVCGIILNMYMAKLTELIRSEYRRIMNVREYRR